jgi:hypothetical protein
MQGKLNIMEIQISSKFKPEKMRAPVGRPVRFAKLGENADHPLTIKMREIKASLGMTTNELVKAVNRFEKEHAHPEFSSSEVVSSSYIPLKRVLLSSYLQGWVMQKDFMESVHKRLEAYWNFAKQDKPIERPTGIKSLMEGWFNKLGIDPNDEAVSPHRELARRISHVCKRAVVIDRQGVFQAGGDFAKSSELGWYAIHDEGLKSQHCYLYRKADGLLVQDGEIVSPGDVVQYSKEITSNDPLYVVSQENPINQSTFYRWYRSNKLPRARVAIELIENAVNEVAAEK